MLFHKGTKYNQQLSYCNSIKSDFGTLPVKQFRPLLVKNNSNEFTATQLLVSRHRHVLFYFDKNRNYLKEKLPLAL